MRLIDADALLNQLEDWRGDKEDLDMEDGHDVAYYSAMSRAMRFTKFSPTIDAVPVVRCKDCKHWGMLEGPPETENIKCCEFGQYMVGENGYCVYGEVKEHD